MNFRIGCLVAMVAALAGPASAQDAFIKGTYSTPEGCAALKANKVEEGDFLFLTARGFEAIEFNCQFLQVLPRNDLPGALVVAFCEEPGLQYPALFTVMPLTDTTLQVGTIESGEPPDDEEEATPAPAAGEAEADDDGLAGEYQLCPGT